MHHTTLLVLLLLVFGQFFILGCAALFLWLAGEFGDPPNWRNLLRKIRTPDFNMTREAAVSAPLTGDELLHRLPLSPGLAGARNDDGMPCSIDPGPSDATTIRPRTSVS
jgi:uncharacterized membrane protein